MSQTRFAFVKAQWHADIVDRAFAEFQDSLGGKPSMCSMFPAPWNYHSWH